MISLFLYNLGIWAYRFLIFIVAPFNAKAQQWQKGRKNVFEALAKNVDPNAKNVWFHVSSLGEFEQGRPVMEAFKKDFPDYKIILTFFSPSGYEIRKNYSGADAIYYLPLDTRRNARRFIELVNPKVAFFVKYEFWFHYLKALHQNEIPTLIFSAIFRPKQLFFKWYGTWYRKLLHYFTHLFVQNQQSLSCLQSIGVDNASIGGDTRFDRVVAIANQRKHFPLIEKFTNNTQTLVVGSSWPDDEDLLEGFLKAYSKPLKLIIAPHEIHDAHITQIMKRFGDKALRYSQINESTNLDLPVLIVDTMGMLSSIYAYGQVAYIGGGFGSGIHNTLEAATYGIPVLFGPKFQKFQEAVDLLQNGGGFTVNNQEDFNKVLISLLDNKTALKTAGKFASQYVQEMCGGTLKISEFLHKNGLVQ